MFNRKFEICLYAEQLMNGPGTEAVLSPTVNTEGEKDGGVGRNAILQRSLFNSTSPLSIPYIFFIHITRIDLVTILRFSHLKLNQIPSFSFVNSKLGLLKNSKFKILVPNTITFPTVHVFPSLNISSRLEQTVSS